MKRIVQLVQFKNQRISKQILPRYCPPRRELIMDSVPAVESPSVNADEVLYVFNKQSLLVISLLTRHSTLTIDDGVDDDGDDAPNCLYDPSLRRCLESVGEINTNGIINSL